MRGLFVLFALFQFSVDGLLLRTTRCPQCVRGRPLKSTRWQDDLDSALDVDTSCEARQQKLQDLLQNRANEISSDVREAVRSRDRRVVAPSSTKYGKALDGLAAFRQQLARDIIPELLTKGVPQLLREGPKLLSEALSEAPKQISQLVEQAREISSDASALQSTTEELRREVKNVFKSTPEGLDTPSYIVLLPKAGAGAGAGAAKLAARGYEIRSYAGYSVCTTIEKTDSVGAMASGRNFNTLAGYIFGDNKQEEKMSMTTPVIMGSDGAMSFVLPRGRSAATAPLPKTDKVMLRDVDESLVAAREFTGICTEAEVSAQRALLEDALLSDGVAYDNLSLQVLQYNPPYTLPWLRRNEVLLKLTAPRSEFVEAALEAVVVEPHEQAPEAGD